MPTTSAHIRTFLVNYFSDEDIGILCFDYFRECYESFGAGMSKVAKVQTLIEYCERHQQLATLLAAFEKLRPEQYPNWKLALQESKQSSANNASKPSQKEDEVSKKSIRLTRVQTGKELLALMTGTLAWGFENDDLVNEGEIILIGDFLQSIEDFIEIHTTLESRMRIQLQGSFNQSIQTLLSNGFLVYAAKSSAQSSRLNQLFDACIVHVRRITKDIFNPDFLTLAEKFIEDSRAQNAASQSE